MPRLLNSASDRVGYEWIGAQVLRHRKFDPGVLAHGVLGLIYDRLVQATCEQ